MPIPKWLTERPDFSDQDKYEEAGWIRMAKLDLPVRNGEIMEPCSVGTIKPADKLATLTRYENESLGLFAEELDFFDQGIVYTEWRPLNFKKGDPVGVALKVDERHWRVKNPNEMFDIWGDSKVVEGKRITHKIVMIFYNFSYGRREILCKLEIEREDD
jgi:hypothetical protein